MAAIIMTVLLDGSPIGTFTETDETLTITFSSTLSNSQFEALIRSVGITGVQAVGLRSGTLVLADPEGNTSSVMNLAVSFVAQNGDDGEYNLADNADGGLKAPDTGVGNGISHTWLFVLVGVGMVTMLAILLRGRKLN